jgi:hypothetical protein
VFVAKNGVLLVKEFLTKGLSGRIIQLDEVAEPEQDQSSVAPEVIPETATTSTALAPQVVWPRKWKFVLNHVYQEEFKIK